MLVSGKHWCLLSHSKREISTTDFYVVLTSQGHGDRNCSAFIHCFLVLGFLFGFSRNFVKTKNGWDRPQKDIMIFWRLEVCFPKCRKHTIGGITDNFRSCKDKVFKKKTNTKMEKIHFPPNSHLIFLRTFGGKSLVWCWYIFNIFLLLVNCILIRLERH